MVERATCPVNFMLFSLFILLLTRYMSAKISIYKFKSRNRVGIFNSFKYRRRPIEYLVKKLNELFFDTRIGQKPRERISFAESLISRGSGGCIFNSFKYRRRPIEYLVQILNELFLILE